MEIVRALAAIAILVCPTPTYAKADAAHQHKNLSPAFTTPGKTATDKAKTNQVAEGVFLGIEEGDYFHWKIRTSSGEERSFLMLRPDASVEQVAAKPKAFVGRSCRVTWKKSKENIPEAGGTMEVEQILSVEWLKK